MLTPPNALEAVLFASGEPMEKMALAKLLEIDEEKLEVVLSALSADLKNRGLVVIDSGKEVELRTIPAAATLIHKLRENELTRDLGKAGLETLAVIAYPDSATRSEVDWVRGVNSSTSIRTLLLRGLISSEEDPADRRRIRYRVTTEALAHLGVTSLKALPRYGELSKEAGSVVAEEASPK